MTETTAGNTHGLLTHTGCGGELDAMEGGWHCRKCGWDSRVGDTPDPLTTIARALETLTGIMQMLANPPMVTRYNLTEAGLATLMKPGKLYVDALSAVALYVVAHDGGCEGHSLPMLAFWDADDAFAWCDSQTDFYSVARVPIFPRLPTEPWFRLEKLTRPKPTGATPCPT